MNDPYISIEGIFQLGPTRYAMLAHCIRHCGSRSSVTPCVGPGVCPQHMARPVPRQQSGDWCGLKTRRFKVTCLLEWHP